MTKDGKKPDETPFLGEPPGGGGAAHSVTPGLIGGPGCPAGAGHNAGGGRSGRTLPVIHSRWSWLSLRSDLSVPPVILSGAKDLINQMFRCAQHDKGAEDFSLQRTRLSISHLRNLQIIAPGSKRRVIP